MPVPPPMTALPPRERWIATGSLMLGMVAFTIALMMTNVILPHIMTSLRADLDQVQWVLTGPGIAQTVVMPMVGWLESHRASGPLPGESGTFLRHRGVEWPGLEHRVADRLPDGQWTPPLGHQCPTFDSAVRAGSAKTGASMLGRRGQILCLFLLR